MSEDEFIEFELNEAELAELSLFRASVRSPVPEHARSDLPPTQDAGPSEVTSACDLVNQPPIEPTSEPCIHASPTPPPTVQLSDTLVSGQESGEEEDIQVKVEPLTPSPTATLAEHLSACEGSAEVKDSSSERPSSPPIDLTQVDDTPDAPSDAVSTRLGKRRATSPDATEGSAPDDPKKQKVRPYSAYKGHLAATIIASLPKHPAKLIPASLGDRETYPIRGVNRCSTCMEQGRKYCVVIANPHRRLGAWAHSVRDSGDLSRRPPNSRCLHCQESRNRFCTFRYIKEVLGEGFRPSDQGRPPSAFPIKRSNRSHRSTPSSDEEPPIASGSSLKTSQVLVVPTTPPLTASECSVTIPSEPLNNPESVESAPRTQPAELGFTSISTSIDQLQVSLTTPLQHRLLTNVLLAASEEISRLLAHYKERLKGIE